MRILGVSREEVPAVERIVWSLSRERLELAERELELELLDQTADDGTKELLRSIPMGGFWQPMSRRHRPSLRCKSSPISIRYAYLVRA